MKRNSGLAIAMMAFALLPLHVASAQQNIVSWSIGGPKTNFTIVNDTADGTPIIVSVGYGKNVQLKEKGSRFTSSFGPFSSSQGELPIFINGCSSIDRAYRYNDPPAWSTDTGNFPGIALTKEYLTTHPSESALKGRVEQFKRTLHHQLGGKEKESELKQWFDLVKKVGITTEVMNCNDTMPISLKGFNWSSWNGTGYNQEVILTVAGDHTHGYRVVNPARTVY